MRNRDPNVHNCTLAFHPRAVHTLQTTPPLRPPSRCPAALKDKGLKTVPRSATIRIMGVCSEQIRTQCTVQPTAPHSRFQAPFSPRSRMLSKIDGRIPILYCEVALMFVVALAKQCVKSL